MSDRRMEGPGPRRVAGGGGGRHHAPQRRPPAGRGRGRGLAQPPPARPSAAATTQPAAASGALSASEQAELAQFRSKKGLCPTCGQKTHKINVLTRKRVPLTIEGKCLAGTCLTCNRILPRDQLSVAENTLDKVVHDGGHDDEDDELGGDVAGRGRGGNAPMPGAAPLGVLELTATRGVIPSEDEYSVVSGLTMDPDLLRLQSRGRRQSGNTLHTENTERPENYLRQPHLSALTEENEGDVLAADPADLIREEELQKTPSQHDDGYDTGSDIDDDTFDIGRHYFGAKDAAAPTKSMRSSNSGGASSRNNSSSSDPKLISVYGGSYEDVRNRIANRYAAGANSGARGAVEQTGPLHDDSRNTLTSFDPPSLSGNSQRNSGEESKMEIEETQPPELASYRTMTSAEIREIEDAFEALEKPALVSWRTGGSVGSSCHGLTAVQSKSSQSTADKNNAPGTEEAPVILYCLHAYPDNADLNEKAFNALFTLATSVECRRKSEILSNNGVKCIVDGLWRHMEVPSVQEAGLFALWALAVSEEGGSVSKGAKSIADGRALDATLISMQTHLHFPLIQYAGCGILSCLARAAKLEKTVDDGTSSGAMFQVVSALDAHSTASPVQEWGIRALVNECDNSSTNKMNLVKTGEGSLGDGGNSGILSIYKAMKGFPGDIVILEWGLRLMHCVSSYENAAAQMSMADRPVERILEVLEDRKRDPKAMRLCEEGIGALSYLSAFEQNGTPMRVAGAIKTVSNIMMFHPRVERIQVLSCRLLANIASYSQEAILRSDATRIVLSAMRAFSTCAPLQEEACRLIRVLCAESSDGRASVSGSAGMSSVVRAMSMHTDSSKVQEQAAGVFAGMASEEAWCSVVASSGALDVIFKAMSAHPKDRSLQEICCIALRNLSTCSDARNELTVPDRLETIVHAMTLQEESEVVQENVCGILWNLSANMARGSPFINLEDIEHIVKAMQNFPDAPGIQKAACGAIWSLATFSDAIQNAVAINGGIDAIMCALLLHQDKPDVLELPVGVLCALSVNRGIVKSIAEAGCIAAATELIRNHMSCSPLFQTSCLFLHNMAYFDTNYAEEASAACSSIVRGMEENPDDATLIRAACCALSSLAANAEACRERIHACGGVSTIARAKERFRNFADVWSEAEGALAQLA